MLRAAIAARYTARGVPTAPEQIVVTAGAQHALTLLLRVLAGPGDRVLTEHPSYPPSSSGTGTGRAPIARIASSAAG